MILHFCSFSFLETSITKPLEVDRHQSFFRLIFEKWNYTSKPCKTNTTKTPKIIFTSNYWYLCQNSCSWKMFWIEFVVGTFKNICTVAVHYWYIKDLSTYFWKRNITEDILLAGCFHLNSKVISKSSSSLQRRQSFMQYQAVTCFGMQTSPVVFFHVIRS